MASLTTPKYWYNVARLGLYSSSILAFLLAFFVDAPFGRFAPLKESIFVIDGIKSWMCMESVSPAAFLATFVTAPFSTQFPTVPLHHPSVLLAALYAIHYANRAFISPMRTPSRSRAHVIVGILGAPFNLANGYSMGAYLSSPAARSFLSDAYTRPLFLIGIALWVIGFIGNVVHDEILLDIRRKAASKRKKGTKGEYYGIPQGMLYRFISYPNYFCEWIEWTGFALAAAPPPALRDLIFPITLSRMSLDSVIRSGVPEAFTPPWVFVICEVLTMLPRAYRGHEWYLKTFPEYPKNRKVIVPFIF